MTDKPTNSAEDTDQTTGPETTPEPEVENPLASTPGPDLESDSGSDSSALTDKPDEISTGATAESNTNASTDTNTDTNTDTSTDEDENPFEGYSSPSDEYFSDDDRVLRGDDDLILNEKNRSFIKQETGSLDVKVSGLYTDEDDPSSRKVKNSLALRTNPPVMEITAISEDGIEIPIELDVSESFAQVMGTYFTDIYRAYNGVKPKSDLTFKESAVEAWHDTINWAKRHKVLAVVLSLLALYFLYLVIFG